MAIETYKNAIIKLDHQFQTIYTCPTGKSSVIHSLYCSNTSTSTIYPSFRIYRPTGPAPHYFYAGNKLRLPPNITLAWDKPLNLKAEDELQVAETVIADPNGNLNPSDPTYQHLNVGNVFASIMELYNNTFERYNSILKIIDEADGPTIVYTCPSTYANSIIHGLQLTNVSTSSKTFVTISIVDNDNTAYILGYKIQVISHAAFIWDKTINLTPGQKLRITVGDPTSGTQANNAIHAIISLLEVEAIA